MLKAADILVELDNLEGNLDAIPAHIYGKSTEQAIKPLRIYLDLQRQRIRRELDRREFVLTVSLDWFGTFSVRRAGTEEWIVYGQNKPGDEYAYVDVTLYLYANAVLEGEDYYDYIKIENDTLSGLFQDRAAGSLNNIWLDPGIYRVDESLEAASVFLGSEYYPSPNIDVVFWVELILSLAFEPADWYFTARDMYQALKDGDYFSFAVSATSLLPFYSHKLHDIGKLSKLDNLDESVQIMARAYSDEQFEGAISFFFENPKEAKKFLSRLDLENLEVVELSDIRASQYSVSSMLSTGEELTDLASRMGEKGYGFGYSPVDIVEIEVKGEIQYITLDHRRLIAAQEAGVDVVPAIVHAPSDPILSAAERFTLSDELSEATYQQLSGLLEKPIEPGYVAETWGEAAYIRAANQREFDPNFPLETGIKLEDVKK